MPLGAGSSIQDLEDFIVSNNLLPIGSLIYLLFCTSRYGWGWDKFQKEANAGSGIKFPGLGQILCILYSAIDRIIYLCAGILE